MNAPAELEDTALEVVGQQEISTAVFRDFQEGMALMESGCASDAIPMLTRCVEREPEFTAGHMCLGVAHALSYNVYPAIDHLEKAATLSPDDFRTHYTLAKFYFTLRIPNKGYQCSERALACIRSRDQRAALAQLLQKERQREQNGIARPLFNRKFSVGFVPAMSAVAGFFGAIVDRVR